jgi:cardiolipin synthase A/B
VKLLTQPGDGVAPLIKGIDLAKNSIEIAIFRFDRPEVKRALEKAAARGVSVKALIAYTNRGGERNLRKLEMELLASGITVARTADDLLRYHYKFMIIDRRILYLLAFNFTYLDTEHSRSFGVVTRNRRVVQEAAKLFEADSKRQAYTPELNALIVSPVNTRKELPRFIRSAKRQLLIYDPKISDRSMIRLLDERSRSGVEIRIIGRLGKRALNLRARRLTHLRLHTRIIIRDRTRAFIGSQSLRDVELDKRRELGLILRDARVVKGLLKTFKTDWQGAAEPKEYPDQKKLPQAKVAKRMAKNIAEKLPLTPIVKNAVKQFVGEETDVELDPRDVQESVKDAVKEAVKDVVKEAVEQNAEK